MTIRKISTRIIIAAISFCLLQPTFIWAQNDQKTRYGKLAWQESAIPIRPGVPGKTPFWNSEAHQFIYAPAFDYKKINKAVKYRYDILSLADSSKYSFENNTPYAALSKVWPQIPIGYFNLSVTGVSQKGKNLDRKSTRLNSSHQGTSRMPSSA